jgi:hypothetical protein
MEKQHDRYELSLEALLEQIKSHAAQVAAERRRVSEQLSSTANENYSIQERCAEMLTQNENLRAKK